MRLTAISLALTMLALVLASSAPALTTAHAGGDREGGSSAKLERAGAPKPEQEDRKDGTGEEHDEAEKPIVQKTKLRERDPWAFGENVGASPTGAKVKGKATLTRRASGIRLEIEDRDAIAGHAYSIWFQVCPLESTFTDFDTQCSLSKLINMNGSGNIATADGLEVTFELATGVTIGEANVCGFKPLTDWLSAPCGAWSVPGILAGSTPSMPMVFTPDIALSYPVRIVVKDHGPTEHVIALGSQFGWTAEQALFTATHRTDGPECQPARPICPDAHVALFATPTGDHDGDGD